MQLSFNLQHSQKKKKVLIYNLKKKIIIRYLRKRNLKLGTLNITN